jgi:hypothetical protein
LRDLAAGTWADAPTMTVHDLAEDGMPPLRVIEGAAQATCRLELAGQAQFDAAAPPRRFVTLSVGGIKQAYEGGHGRAEVAFRAGLRLDTGLNTVTIQAQAGPRRMAERQLLVHCGRAGP